MSFLKYLEKEIQKSGKRKGGALAGRGLASCPLAKAGPARPRVIPLPAPVPRPRTQTATLRRRGTPAAFGRRVARMRRGGRTLVGHQVRPTAPASFPAARRTPPLALSLSFSPTGSSSLRRRSPFPPALGAPLSPAAPASSLPSATTQLSRSIALGKPRAPVRAHRSESELRRPLGSRGSPSPLRHCLCF